MTTALALVVLAGCAATGGPSVDDGADRESMGDYEQITQGDVRLWAHATAGNGEGEGAIVTGVLGVDAGGSCLVLEQHGDRYPVVWPYGTELLNDDPVRIGLADGAEVTVGTHLEGGGGYHQAEQLPVEIPDACLSPTGEVAHFNRQSGIEQSG